MGIGDLVSRRLGTGHGLVAVPIDTVGQQDALDPVLVQVLLGE